ncbi:hypothetical protein MWH25_04595 [Natroniella acetigena]|uniref:hypothetical protein n=1 Tax=Natroniella acetigena TaxID=52004 RepID=UPI00200B852B|nr:hypothetical protein [Natroniella acetigena]MCK8827027.1 hypothetical protein [Natroniella acetigena]
MKKLDSIKSYKRRLNRLENKLRSMRALATKIKDNDYLNQVQKEKIKQDFKSLKEKVKVIEKELKKEE